MAEQITTLSQTINFLGFLRGQLNGLNGLPTLCYEMIQNADDVRKENGDPGATRITFDVCDDALFVYNDGVFRDIDFERMMNVSWGNKREEAGTTGAFGLGFISVYQITDSPEIFSSGRHWRFIPDGPEDKRIHQQMIQTRDTMFRLPWAFTESNIRGELHLPPIKKEDLNAFVEQINTAIYSAALFLKQITCLELKRNGRLIRKIETAKVGSDLLLADGERDTHWRIFEGSFDQEAEKIRGRFGQVIEMKRQSRVKIAVAKDPSVNGLLYAYLPSEMNTGLPFHINADFYPTQDRKRIIFGEGHKAEWNDIAIRCAASILAENCYHLVEYFSSQEFWNFTERVWAASVSANHSRSFSMFWQLFKPMIETNKCVLTGSNKKVRPSEALFLTNELTAAQNIIEDLGINSVHTELISFHNVLFKTGVTQIELNDLVTAFSENGLNIRVEQSKAPKRLRSVENWRLLWDAINHLLATLPFSAKQVSIKVLQKMALVFGSDGAIWPPEKLFTGSKDDRDLFSKIGNVVWYVEKSDKSTFPSSLAPVFTLSDGIEILKKNEDNLQLLWELGEFSPKEMLEWFDKHRLEINPTNCNHIRILSIWPSSRKQLKPLIDLFLPGDYEDPLSLAQLVDLEELGGGRDFLEKYLHVTQLDFITYVKNWVPSVIRERELDKKKKLHLIAILAENLGKIRDHQEIRQTLSKLPLIWCENGTFTDVGKVWFESQQVKDILGSEVLIAKLPTVKAEAIKELYRWLGVKSEPNPIDVVHRIEQTVLDKPNKQRIDLIGRCIQFISSKWGIWDESDKEQLSRLCTLRWLPGSSEEGKWFPPAEVYSEFSKHLFESQGNFLLLDYKVQVDASKFFDFITIESQPSIDQVINHLLYSSEKNQSISQKIYEYLNPRSDNPLISKLIGKKCLFVLDHDGTGTYYYPDNVYWGPHCFNKYRFRLSPEYGRYKNIFEKIGVKEGPDVEDAIKVLLAISKEYGEANNFFSDELPEYGVLISCWKMISEGLEKDQIEERSIATLIGEQKSIPDINNRLQKPTRMFFEDRPGWGDKFIGVKNNLISRIAGAWMGMEAAGVRSLSSVIETEISMCENRIIDSSILEQLDEREDLLSRVIEAHRNEGIKELHVDRVTQLTYYQADCIEVRRIFTGFRREYSEPEIVDALLLGDCFYFSLIEGKYPWQSIARELSFVMNPTGELKSLGMELKEILSHSHDEAAITLDELGYPAVKVVESNLGEGLTLEYQEDIESIRVTTEMSDLLADARNSVRMRGEPELEKKIAGHEIVRTREKRRENFKEKRKSSRLISYVYPEDTLSTKKASPESLINRNRVSKIGIERVMKYEKEEHRNPKDMETVKTNHPGYDIESIDQNGNKRYIEVKSLSGVWDSQNPAQITRTEFEMSQNKGEDYWLYVVELAESDEYIINLIQNPGNRVEYYLFDHGWMSNHGE